VDLRASPGDMEKLKFLTLMGLKLQSLLGSPGHIRRMMSSGMLRCVADNTAYPNSAGTSLLEKGRGKIFHLLK
jgi:hypothetical protein